MGTIDKVLFIFYTRSVANVVDYGRCAWFVVFLVLCFHVGRGGDTDDDDDDSGALGAEKFSQMSSRIW